MNGFIKSLFLFVSMKFNNIAKTGNFFEAFLHKEAIYSSKLKVLSVYTPKCFYLLLSQVLVFPIFLSDICLGVG